MDKDTIYRVGILLFIIIFVFGGTILEFKKPKKKSEENKINKDGFNKIIIESLKKEESDNSNI